MNNMITRILRWKQILNNDLHKLTEIATVHKLNIKATGLYHIEGCLLGETPNMLKAIAKLHTLPTQLTPQQIYVQQWSLPNHTKEIDVKP